MSLLDRIQDPEDLRQLREEDLPQLAAELRSEMIRAVEQNGGHLASNLGVTELTIALLRRFDFRRDVLIFDVGHQCYAYKMLTGRRPAFARLRRKNGLSGFPKREESPYDFFNTGHASTSLSAADGYQKALKYLGKEAYVVAVIGDGALTGGMCWEAMNNLVNGKDRVIVILNDNGMSIDKNVGALDQLLTQLRVRPSYLRFKLRSERVLEHLPLVGGFLHRILGCSKQWLRRHIQPRSILFEEFGFKYYGPVDGHDLKALGEQLEAAKRCERPVLLHVCTTKGKGYIPAEQNPGKFHGISPGSVCPSEEEQDSSPIRFFKPQKKNFSPPGALVPLPATESCFFDSLREQKTYTDAFGYAANYFAAREKRLLAVTAAMMQGTGLVSFAQRYPDRFFDVGIAEPHAVTMAAGMAAAGALPLVAIYSTFMQRALDQLLHDVCLQKLKVIFAVDRAGVVGEDGETHQGIYDLSFVQSLPSVEVLTPGDALTLAAGLHAAIFQARSAVMLRYPRGKVCFDLRELGEAYLPVISDEEAARGEEKESALPRFVLSSRQNLSFTFPSWRLFVPRTSSLSSSSPAGVISVEGKILLLTFGGMSERCLRAWGRLTEEQRERYVLISCERVKPLPAKEFFPLLREVEKVLIFEECVRPGVIFPALCELLQKEKIFVQIETFHLGEGPIEQGKSELCLEEYGLAGEALAAILRKASER